MTITLTEIGGTGILDQFHNDGMIKSGLPAFAYNDESYWQLEKQKLFAENWVFVGFVHEFKTTGDARPITVGGKPVLLVRDKAGRIRAFHNVCRHRCLKLVDQVGNVGPRIRCPYHSWVYGLDGALRSTPYFGGLEKHTPDGFDPAQHGLVEVNCEAWHDWIFVNLNDNPLKFESFVKPISDRTCDIDFDLVVPVATLDFGEVETNWKLLMENFIEPYHVQFVHATTTDQPLKDHYTVDEGACLGSAVDISEPTASGSNTLAVSSLYLTLFPNFVFGRYFPDQIGVHLNFPLDVDRTGQKRVIYMTDGRKHGQDQIDALKELWYKVHKEDHAMVERLQSAKTSDVAAGGGVLSPHWENSVRRFQELALQAVEEPVDKS